MEPTDINERGTDAIMGEDDIMINVKGFYPDYPDDSHQEPTAENEGESVPTMAADT